MPFRERAREPVSLPVCQTLPLKTKSVGSRCQHPAGAVTRPDLRGAQTQSVPPVHLQGAVPGVLLCRPPTMAPAPPTPRHVESNQLSFCFPSINNKLQQPEAAAGVLEYAMKHFGELVSASFLLGKQEVAPWQGRHSAATLREFLPFFVLCFFLPIDDVCC